MTADQLRQECEYLRRELDRECERRDEYIEQARRADQIWIRRLEAQNKALLDQIASGINRLPPAPIILRGCDIDGFRGILEAKESR